MVDNIDKKIEDSLNLLQDWEDIDPAYLQNDIKELRHKIMHIHLRIEASLDILIGDHVTEGVGAFLEGKKLNDFQLLLKLFRWDLQIVLDEIDFAKKVKIAVRAKKIDKKTQGKLFKINDLRVIFSHPQAHQNIIQTFNNKNKYLETLITLIEGYKAMDSIFVNRDSKLKKSK